MFSFNTTKDSVYVKIIPNSSAFPNYIPTYHDSVFTINEATLIRFNVDRFKQIDYDIMMADISSLGGGYKIGGLVYTNTPNNLIVNSRLASLGTIQNLNLILVNSSNKPVLHTTTNSDGYFKFENLNPDTYKIYVDYPFINNTLAPFYTISTSSKDSMSFVLHKTYLTEESPSITLNLNKETLFDNIKICPNPFSNSFSIQYELKKPAIVNIELFDMTGQKIINIENIKQDEGLYNYPLTINQKGIFTLNVIINGEFKSYKIINN